MEKLKVEKISVSFNEKEVLKDISFDIKDGEFVSILGTSGCGKSTILNVLSGILKQNDGNVFVDGEKINGISQKFAYMPQKDLLLPWKNIESNVRLFEEINNIKEKKVVDFEKFGLKGTEKMYPHELSGGMRQRVAFLRTTMCNADIFLLDEPFASLDVCTRNSMQDWLLSMQFNKTTVLVTHDIDEAIYLSNKIFILKDGKITAKFEINHEKRTREWLFEQVDIKKKIYKVMSE